MQQANHHSDRILRVRELCDRAGVSRQTLYRLAKLGTFPRLKRIGKHAVGLPESDFLGWMRSREAA